MTEAEKKQKIDLLIQEFKKRADELAKESKKDSINRLDNGRTEYTELYEKYKKKIDEVKSS